MIHEVFRDSDVGVVTLAAFLVTLTGSFSFCNLNEAYIHAELPGGLLRRYLGIYGFPQTQIV